jgi:hypothetical protein
VAWRIGTTTRDHCFPFSQKREYARFRFNAGLVTFVFPHPISTGAFYSCNSTLKTRLRNRLRDVLEIVLGLFYDAYLWVPVLYSGASSRMPWSRKESNTRNLKIYSLHFKNITADYFKNELANDNILKTEGVIRSEKAPRP